MAVAPRPEHRPLLTPGGLHALTLAELHLLTAAQPDTPRRHDLWAGFAALYLRMTDAGLAGLSVWVDGSFMTTKANPGDVDCVLWVPQSHIDACSDSQYEALVRLKDRDGIRYKYSVDLYIVPPEDAALVAYWTDWFSVARDGVTPKGFAAITL